MKKTLLTLVIFLTGLTASAVAANELTFTTTIGQVSNSTLYGVKFNLGDNSENRYTVSPSLAKIPAELILESVAFKTFKPKDGTTYNLNGTYYLYVTETSGTLVAVSQASTFSNLAGGSDAVFNFADVTTVGDKSFNNALTLSASKSYTAYFATGSALTSFEIGSTASANTTTSINISMGRNGTDYTAANAYQWGVISSDSKVTTNSKSYTPEMTIKTQYTPEPTTATLSLLALAGLAARRRRK